MKTAAIAPAIASFTTAASAAFAPGQPWVLLVGLIALTAIMAALLRAWQLTTLPDIPLAPPAVTWTRVHILCHVIPLAFVTSRLHPSGQHWLADTIWVIALLPFFWSGRQTWHALLKALGSKLYWIFKRGNTAMLIMPVLLLAVGHTLDSTALIHFVPRLLLLYCAIHFIIIGLAVGKIASDVVTPPTPSHPDQHG